MAQETVKQITQGGVTRPVEDEVARQKADSAIQGVIVNGTEVAPDSSTKKVGLNIPAQAPVDDQMSGTSEHAVQNKVIKAYVDGLIQGLQNVLNTITQDGATQGVIDTFNEVKAFLEGISSSDTLAAKLLLKQDALIAGNGIVIGNDGKTVSVDAEVVQPVTADGTFAVRIGNDTYTINLNHTHENMAKLIVCEESDLPSTLEEDTIYGVEEDGEISVLYVGGIPFYGGGAPTTEPIIRRPVDGSTIDMGNTSGGSLSKTINIKGKNLTEDLTIELDGTGYTFGNPQPTGVTIVSATELTVTAAAANALNGVDIVVVYTGSAENADSTLSISSGSPDNISCEATLIANVTVYEDLAGVKFTGTQWLQTDYYPNANTEFEMRCHFIENGSTQNIESSNARGILLSCLANEGDGKKFSVYQFARYDQYAVYNAYGAGIVNEQGLNDAGHSQDIRFLDDHEKFLVDNLKMFYRKAVSNGVFGFNSGGTEYTVTTSLKTSTMETAMFICKYRTGTIYSLFDLVVYELKITENGTTVRDWVPKTRNGVPGLYDTVNDTFMSSETSDDLVAIPLT